MGGHGALGVVAFRDGGATAVGLVGLLRMAPAALVTPFAASVADKLRRELVLDAVCVVRAATLALAALVLATGGDLWIVYAALVIATVAQTLYRPAHSALLPSLCSTPAELTSANVVRGLLDSVATLTGPLAAALLLGLSGPDSVFLAAAAVSLFAAVLTARIRYEAPPTLVAPRAGRQVLEGLLTIATTGDLRLLTALTTLQTFTRGALTVLSVVVAIELLDTGDAGVGVLNAAVGVGAVVGSLAVALVAVGGGRLARLFGLGVALWGAPVALIGALPEEWAAIALLAVVGLGNALVDVGAFTLPARLADDALLARVFAAFEGILTMGVALGALVTPLLIDLLGTRAALVAIGTAAPLAVLSTWRALGGLDRRIEVRDAELELLNRVPMLRPLPKATLERLAAGADRLEVPAGTNVFEAGERGTAFFVIESGEAHVIGEGERIRALGPGEGFGEIALLRDTPRTATIRAATDLTLRTLQREAFAAAVCGYSTSAVAVEEVIGGHLERDSARRA